MNDFVKSELNRYIDYISTIDGVKRIYLFGSYAYGEPTEDSDIDLAVIVSDGKDRLKMMYTVEKGLANRDVPLDIIVDCESSFEKACRERVTMQSLIRSEGVLLYGE